MDGWREGRKKGKGEREKEIGEREDKQRQTRI